jgi:hypothetical protein
MYEWSKDYSYSIQVFAHKKKKHFWITLFESEVNYSLFLPLKPFYRSTYYSSQLNDKNAIPVKAQPHP